VDDEGIAKRTRSVCRGTEGGTEETERQSKLGNLSAQVRPGGESISWREGSRVSDEVIVREDPAGQQNPLASQGALDGSFSVRRGECRLDASRYGSLLSSEIWTLAAYKPTRGGRLEPLRVGEGRCRIPV
jgi:hypothetical protein